MKFPGAWRCLVFSLRETWFLIVIFDVVVFLWKYDFCLFVTFCWVCFYSGFDLLQEKNFFLFFDECECVAFVGFQVGFKCVINFQLVVVVVRGL